MKPSTKIILPIILISALLILLAGCVPSAPDVPDDEDPGYTPGTTTISGIIAAPCCSTSSAVVSDAPSDWCLQCEQNWFIQKNIEVILTYEGEEIGSTTTNTLGEYTFTNLSAGENYVITAICPDDGGYPLVKDVVKEVVDGEDYDAGITDCESTALGLIVDALVNLGISSEYIILEDIQGAVKFESFVEAVCEVLESCGDVTSDENLLDQGNLVLMEVLGENPGWTGGEVICVFNPPDDPCIGVPPPTANAGPDQCFVVCPSANELVDLVGSGSGKGTLSYAWDLDNDGQFDDSAVQNPQDVPFGAGVHTVRLRVTDECGSAIDEMIVTITECINTAPKVSTIPIQSISAEGAVQCIPTYEFTVSNFTSDDEGNNLKYSFVGNIPAGMTINENSGKIVWVPVCGNIGLELKCHQCGTVCITVRVEDDGCCQPLYTDVIICIDVFNGPVDGEGGTLVGIGFDGCPILDGFCNP